LAQKQKRIRRRPEDAKALILDAAEASLKAGGGPAALRLQDVARAAGVSHPTILHHFGSRKGLVRALNLRSLEALTAGVIERMREAKSGDEGIRRTFEAYRDGLAQRTMWLLQSQEQMPRETNVTMFEDIVQGLHAIRERYALPGHVPDIEDTRSVVHLTTIAAFGDALIGPRLRSASGPGEEARRERFIKWFANLLDMYFDAAR
jgi:AcrR family transcriptional regulator